MTDTDQLEAAISAAAARRWPGGRLLRLEGVTGGRSGVTMAASVDTGAAAPLELIIKATPPGREPVGRHDVLRQARILRHLHGRPGLAVPAVELEESGIVTFMAMTRCPGEAIEPILDGVAATRSAALTRKRALVAAGTLAAVHRIDDAPAADAGGLEPGETIAAQLERWTATAKSAGAAAMPHGDRLAKLLAREVPVSGDSCLVHGDWRLGNLVFDGDRLTGIIDWEIWGRTHPGIDVGWFLTFCDPSLFPGVGAPAEGMPPADELLTAYVSAGGYPMDARPFFEAFGQFKMAAIMAHNLRRHREGRHHDPYQENLPPTIARLIESGIEKLD